MSRASVLRIVASVALAAFLLPAVPVSLLAESPTTEMACCSAKHCHMPAMSAPCCSHSSTQHAAPAMPGVTTAPQGTSAIAHWDAIAVDVETPAEWWRARATADARRDRPPDSPHLLNHVFLI